MAGKLLLDTCAAIWRVEGADFGSAARAALEDAERHGAPIYVSPITAWELGLLIARGRIRASVTPPVWFRQLVSLDAIALAEMSADVLIASSFLPGTPPRDPADRIIIATAREAGLTIVTRDRLILDYADAGHVLALAC